MAEVSEGLSLSKAAQQAGVSETTMRSWAKGIPGTERRSDGSYRIPKDSLMGFLASKTEKLRGPRKGGSFQAEGESFPADDDMKKITGELIEQLRADRDRLKEGLSEANQRVKDLEGQNNELVMTLNEQSREFSDKIISLVSQLQLPEPKEMGFSERAAPYSGGHVIDAEHEDSQPSKKMKTKSTKQVSTQKAKPKKKMAIKAKPKAKAKKR